MKKILTFVLILSGISLFGQQSCCSATAQFADLGNQVSFQNEHQEPVMRSAQDYSGTIKNFQTNGDQQGRAYVVENTDETRLWLFVFHEWWGLNEHIMAEADKWAVALPGVNIMAIDLYDGKTASTRDAASELMNGADEDRIREIIAGAIDHVGSSAQVGTIGWCFGGGWSMQAALMLGDQAEACVVYYGMPEQNAEKLEDLETSVLGIFAEKDGWINREQVGKYEQAMDKAGKTYETHWFDAEHAFANPSNEIYDEEAATEAREITAKFLYSRMIK